MFASAGSRGGRSRAQRSPSDPFHWDPTGPTLDMNGGWTSVIPLSSAPGSTYTVSLGSSVPGTGNFASNARIIFGGDFSLAWSPAFVGVELANAAGTATTNLSMGGLSANGISVTTQMNTGDVEIANASWRRSMTLISAAQIGWSSSGIAATPDFFLVRDSSGTLAMRNTAVPQNFRVYNTVDAFPTTTNYERGVIDWTTNANFLTIGTQAGGTGTLRNVLMTASNAVWFFGTGSGTNLNIQSDRIDMATTGILKWFNIRLQPPNATDNVLQFGVTGPDGFFTWGGERRVTSNFTSSTSTLTAITGISSVALQAGRNYAFESWLAVTGSSVAGVQIGITCSSTTITTLLSDGFMHDAGVMRGSSVGVINSTGTPVVAVSSATVTSSNPSIRIDGMIRVASSGLFGLTLAQSTASGTQTIVSSASYMIVYDMP